MNIEKVAQLLLGTIQNKKYKTTQVKGISTDSRNVKKGDLFFALIGENFDGHDFLKEVLKKRPAGIVVSKEISLNTPIPVILVSDTLKALQDLALQKRKNYSIPVIAVTGSVGKTMTKDLIAHILEKKYCVLKSEKNQNNHLGVPFTLLKLEKKHEVVVLEMGMNHFHEIETLSKIALPDVGVITNIGTSHIGNLGSQKNIFKAKMEIIEGMQDGLLVLNGADAYLKKVTFPHILCGGRKGDIKATNVKSDLEKLTFSVVLDGKKEDFSFPYGGKHFLSNVLLAMQVGLLFEVPKEDIKEAIAAFHGSENRMQRFELGKNCTLLDDCYNASFESMAGVCAFAKEDLRKKIFILGDILELGDYSEKIHKRLSKLLKNFKGDEILLVGEAMRKINVKGAVWFADLSSLKKFLYSRDFENKLIILKGSHGMHLEEIRTYLLEFKEELFS